MHARRTIDRYLAVGLGPWAEARMRRHLARCESCRAYYDEQHVLYRALAGAPAEPTAAELERMVARAVRASEASPAPAPPRERTSRIEGLIEALLWSPARVAALAVALVVGGGALVSGLLPRSPVARVARAEGLRAGGAELRAGAEIAEGVELQVDKNGLAELELVRGGRTRLFPGATLSLEAGGDRIELERGKVWCEIERKPGSFEVRTDEARARVLGTSFVVERLAAGGTEVRVARGTVEVEEADGRGRVKLVAGQKSRVAKGAAPSEPARYSPDEDRSAWEGLIEYLRRLGRWIGSGLQKGLELLDGRGAGQ